MVFSLLAGVAIGHKQIHAVQQKSNYSNHCRKFPPDGERTPSVELTTDLRWSQNVRFYRESDRIAALCRQGQSGRLGRDIIPHIAEGPDPIGADQMVIGTPRRQFISALGNTTAAWPRATQVQQPLTSVVGFLSGRSSDTEAAFLAMLRKTFKEAGFVEGQNVAIESLGERRCQSTAQTSGRDPGEVAGRATDTRHDVVGNPTVNIQ